MKELQLLWLRLCKLVKFKKIQSDTNFCDLLIIYLLYLYFDNLPFTLNFNYVQTLINLFFLQKLEFRIFLFLISSCSFLVWFHFAFWFFLKFLSSLIKMAKTLTCRIQFLNDIDFFTSSTNFPEPARPPLYTFNVNIPLGTQIAGVHRLLKAPHRVSCF